MTKIVNLGGGANLAYVMDDFTDPWQKSDVVLLVHGIAEGGGAWFAWVPHLARSFRVLRPDLRGFGRSTPMPRDFEWSLDLLAEDLSKLLRALDVGSVHLVGAKIGATISVRMATKFPEMVRTLTLIGLPVVGSRNRPGLDMETYGARSWARSSMEERLGEDAPPGMLEWWSDLMGMTSLPSLLGFSEAVASFNVSDDLARIRCPVLALTTDSARHPASEMNSWRAKIKDSRAKVLPGEAYHAAAVYPDECALAVRDFIALH